MLIVLRLPRVSGLLTVPDRNPGGSAHCVLSPKGSSSTLFAMDFQHKSSKIKAIRFFQGTFVQNWEVLSRIPQAPDVKMGLMAAGVLRGTTARDRVKSVLSWKNAEVYPRH
ncbi:hypothetical protein ACFQ3C_06850 [Seohaeicola saemankumensis]|uniref:Uncharacterized protein n=1 Tax=Seohaeicola saemankumensis TaxID=481181 RepID=A0ABW3TEA7_9RHOB